MNDNSTTTTPRRSRRTIAAGVAGLAGIAVLATTAPVVAGDLVTSKDLARGAVTTPKIAKKAVKSKQLADGAVKTKDVRDDAITSAKLADGAVTRSHLAADLQPLWAVIWGGPSIVRGKGAVGVQFEGVNWAYRVTFDRDVSQCSYGVTLSQPNSASPEQVGMANVSSYNGDPKAVIVRTRDHDGVGDPKGFTVQVWC